MLRSYCNDLYDALLHFYPHPFHTADVTNIDGIVKGTLYIHKNLSLGNKIQYAFGKNIVLLIQIYVYLVALLNVADRKCFILIDMRFFKSLSVIKISCRKRTIEYICSIIQTFTFKQLH